MPSTATLHDRFISHLDALVVFLALEHDEVFAMLGEHVSTWFPNPAGPFLPGDVEHYRVQVCHSAFLLGYSYMEAFLADLARLVYRRHPGKLPGDKQIKIRDLIGTIQNNEDILTLLIEQEIRATFAGSMKDILSHFKQRLDLTTQAAPQEEMIRISFIRNCLMHNGALASRELAMVSDYTEGDPIRLRSAQVHDFGLVARDFAGDLWNGAAAKRFI